MGWARHLSLILPNGDRVSKRHKSRHLAQVEHAFGRHNDVGGTPDQVRGRRLVRSIGFVTGEGAED